MKPILFSLEHCPKCEAVKEYLKGIDYNILIFPHDYIDWNDEHKQVAKDCGMLEDLKKTAPILFADGKKIIGQLRIKNWVKENGNK